MGAALRSSHQRTTPRDKARSFSSSTSNPTTSGPSLQPFSTSPPPMAPSEEQSLVRRGLQGRPALALVSLWLPKLPGPQPARRCHQIRKPPPSVLLPPVLWGISIFAFSLAYIQNLRPKRTTTWRRAGGRERYLGEDGDVPVHSPPFTLEEQGWLCTGDACSFP